MGHSMGFIDIKKSKPEERDAKKRTADWNEYQKPMPEDKLQEQAARCMDCGTPFCQTGMMLGGTASGCPLYNLIPEWNELVYRGKWYEAFLRLQKTNNFPEFTGRVCPAPCEGGCTAALATESVAIKSIEKEIIDKAFDEGWIHPEMPSKRTNYSIAVIGSGPAGLAAADELNKAGHNVTVIERDDRLGGLLMYGIPNMKLDKKLVDRRIDLLRQGGIRFETNTEIGRDVSLEQLRSRHDAVIFCTGATNHRDLTIEGRELNGVHFAMPYLTESTKHLLAGNNPEEAPHSAKGKRVIVIGGGDTGADCVATAVRQGCKSVVQFGKYPQLPDERKPDNPWPEVPEVFSLDYAYEEAEAEFGKDPREYGVMTKRFISDGNGNLEALETVQINAYKDKDGNRHVDEVPDSKKIWPVDMVFLAIGFVGSEDILFDEVKLEKSERNVIKTTTEDKYQTKDEGVFAAGDARRGQSLIVHAIREGREVAESCQSYLTSAQMVAK